MLKESPKVKLNFQNNVGSLFFFGLAVAIITLLTSVSTFAMSPTEDDPARATIGRSGELFTVQFTPGNRRLTIGFVGKPAMVVDPKKISIFGRVLPTKGDAKNLNIVSVDAHYEITDELPEAAPIEIEIKDVKTKKAEKFRLENKQP